jgi:hypothetical protein
MRHPVTKEPAMTPRVLSALIASGDASAVRRVRVSLAQANGNRGDAARRLGVSRSTLHRWERSCPELAKAMAKIPPPLGPGSRRKDA